jgi:hypothetical protein
MACSEPCPGGCDLACERHATWTPRVGVPFRALPDSPLTHGPGARFQPDGSGGGLLSFLALDARRGFRPGLRLRTIRKQALGG